MFIIFRRVCLDRVEPPPNGFSSEGREPSLALTAPRLLDANRSHYREHLKRERPLLLSTTGLARAGGRGCAPG